MSDATATAVVPARRAVSPTAPVTWTRGGYLDLRVTIGPGANRTKLGRAWRAIETVLGDLEGGRADGHQATAWEIGADFRKKGGGTAVNRSVYGVDLVAGQPLGVVQVRRWERTKYQVRHGYGGSTSRAWFLIGRNEGTKLAFSHAINPRSIVRELRATTPPARPVTLARLWVFGLVDELSLSRIIRQGDVALIPVARLPGGRRERIEGSPEGVQVFDRHVLQAVEAWRYGQRLYARDPYLQHLGEQHADVRGLGWYRVQVGYRSTPRPFARMVGD